MKKPAVTLEEALKEAKTIGQRMAEEVHQLTGGKNVGSVMAEMIPDHMTLFSQLTPADQKALVKQIKKIVWG
jgi:flagellar biosynthesis/type III secretory pathway chaperone